jgi:hypothetical protein
MPTIEERLTSLEARMDSMSDLRNMPTELRGDMNGRLTELRGDMNVRFAQVNGRFSELREDINARAGEVSGRFTEVTSHFVRSWEEQNRLFDALDRKLDRNFRWVFSLQVAALLLTLGLIVAHLR